MVVMWLCSPFSNCLLLSILSTTIFSYTDFDLATAFLAPFFFFWSWFESYLTGRTQTVTVNNLSSRPAEISFGVPQGSVPDPILFILYSAPLSSVIETHSVSKQSFADDTQLLHSCPPDQIHATVLTMQTCTSDVKTWMSQNKLKLNDDKTEALL